MSLKEQKDRRAPIESEQERGHFILCYQIGESEPESSRVEVAPDHTVYMNPESYRPQWDKGSPLAAFRCGPIGSCRVLVSENASKLQGEETTPGGGFIGCLQTQYLTPDQSKEALYVYPVGDEQRTCCVSIRGSIKGQPFNAKVAFVPFK